jgi:aminoglycoside phosphotransferase (APT) family kinase protein
MSNFDHFIGTRAVSEQHAFDTAALSAWLQQNLEGFEGPLSVEMFKGGQSNPTYKLRHPARSYVMRAKPGPVAKLLPSAHAIEREFRVMSGLAAPMCRCRACTRCARTSPSSAAPSTSWSACRAACCGTSPCPA